MKGTPDPLDPNDPRVLVEWTDKLGQKIRPGDYVAKNNYHALSIGKVLLISALRKNGKPFTNPGPQMLIHLCRLSEMELGYWKHATGWDATTLQYTGEELLPLTQKEKYPMLNVIKIDWLPKSERP